MIFDLLTVQVFIEEKSAAIHSKYLSACSFDNHPCCCKPLIGFIGDESSICPSCGNITDVSGGAPQVPNFSGETGLIVLVKPGIGEQQAFIIYIFLIGHGYFLFTPVSGSIGPGDLLTTSESPGHAMKVHNHSMAQGAIIGKAMTSLDQGQGLVLVLVSLQ